jgi:hypothetical protein
MVRVCMANVVGDVTGTLGVSDFKSSKDLGHSIVEERSTSIVDYRTSKHRTSNVDCRMDKAMWRDFVTLGSNKMGIQHQTLKTPTNNAWITSGGNKLQTRTQILMWWRPLEIMLQAVANGDPKIKI